MLGDLNEAGILRNLFKRYMDNNIYVSNYFIYNKIQGFTYNQSINYITSNAPNSSEELSSEAI